MLEIDRQNLLKAEYLIKLFMDDLFESEIESNEEELIPENQEAIIELVEAFAYGDSIELNAKIFFDAFFLLMQEAPYILNPQTIITKFEEAMELFTKLNHSIQESNYDHKQEMLDFLEEYGLTLENRLLAIKNEQRFFKEHLTKCVDASIQVVKKGSNIELFLTLQNAPSPLIGMEDLLNYQVKQLVELNQMIFTKLQEQMTEHNLHKIFIHSDQSIPAEIIEEFNEQFQQDKTDLREIQQKDFCSTDDEELIEDIATELATNLIYRIHWEEKYEIEIG